MFHFLFRAMFFLIAPLLFSGFFVPAYCVTADSETKNSNEHLISLRDYDFVGEDQRLSALLAERMAVLQAPLNLTEPEASGPALEPAGPWPRVPGPIQPKPDYLHSNVRLSQLVNVSMDYAHLINASDWPLEVNASLLTLAPGPQRVLAPGYGRAPALETGRTPDPRPSGTLAPGTDRAPALSHVDGRRYADPSYLDNNKKILEIMKQCIYSTQRKMIELDPLVNKYERDPRFRMAFIYNRLNEWFHDMRTVYFSTMKYRYYPRRVKRVIWYYEHMLRLNIDITYSVEHLVYLHTEYMKNIENIMPLNKRIELRQMKQEQRKLKKMNELGLTSARPGFENFGGKFSKPLPG